MPLCGQFYNVGVDKPPAKISLPLPAPGSRIPANITPVASALGRAPAAPAEDAMKCERCGTEMYRMHAVWRCPSCRFKTDCCGW